MTAQILLTQENSVATLTLNRPERLNAINDDLTLLLEQTLRKVEADETVRVVVIRGAGAGFAAGGDLEEFAAHPERVTGMVERFQSAIRGLASVRKPVIASLHGAVAGGGLGIALACDLAIAAENIKMIFAYTKLAVSCDGGLSHRLPRLVGMRKALEIALIDTPIIAAEALRLGLVNRVVPTDALAVETARIAEQLAKLDTLAVGNAKRLFAESWGRTLEEQLDAEIDSFAVCSARPVFAERIAAVRSRP